MEFTNTEKLKEFAQQYYAENIRQYVLYRKEVIFFPKECSEQMSELVLEVANNSKKIEATLQAHKGSYKLLVNYLTPQYTRKK
jgi:hypothetical protein